MSLSSVIMMTKKKIHLFVLMVWTAFLSLDFLARAVVLLKLWDNGFVSSNLSGISPLIDK
jgi:hypothetical protein